MSIYAGPIRFVGGQQHNRILNVVWNPYLDMPDETPVNIEWSPANATIQFEDCAIRLFTYKLVTMRTGYGTRFWEYHFKEWTQEMSESSGYDGTMRPH